MKQTIKDSKQLLNGMHEGLLIISKNEEKSVIFCNRPARQLLHGAIHLFEKEKHSTEFKNKVIKTGSAATKPQISPNDNLL